MKALLIALALILAVGFGCSDDNSGSTDGNGDGLGGTEWPLFTTEDLGDAAPTTALALADINNDKLLDIITGNGRHAGGQNYYYLNNGDGSFSDGVAFGDTNSPTVGLAVGDIDGDGLIDVLVGNGDCKYDDCQQVDSFVFYNQGSEPYYNDEGDELPGHLRSVGLGTFGDKTRPAAILGSASNAPNNVTIYDNDDGAYGDDASMTLAQIYGTGATTALAVADLNKDGVNDLVVGNRGKWSSFTTTNHPLCIFYGIDDQTFSDCNPLDEGLHYQTLGVAVADVDNDGYLDIVAARGGESPENSAGQQNTVYLYDSQAGGYSDTNTLLFGSGNDASRGVVVADVNNDDRPDIVLSNECQSSYIYLQNKLGQYPTDSTDYAIEIPDTDDTDIRAIAAADLNNDGLVDIVLGNTCVESNCIPVPDDCTNRVLYQTQ